MIDLEYIRSFFPPAIARESRFDRYIFPLIKEGESVTKVMQCTHEMIVEPLMKMLNENGEHDDDLRYTTDHIYGMIYYLTGLCHLNWKDYDNDNVQPGL